MKKPQSFRLPLQNPSNEPPPPKKIFSGKDRESLWFVFSWSTLFYFQKFVGTTSDVLLKMINCNLLNATKNLSRNAILLTSKHFIGVVIVLPL